MAGVSRLEERTEGYEHCEQCGEKFCAFPGQNDEHYSVQFRGEEAMMTGLYLFCSKECLGRWADAE